MLLFGLTVITGFIGTYSFATKQLVPCIIAFILSLATTVFYCNNIKYFNKLIK